MIDSFIDQIYADHLAPRTLLVTADALAELQFQPAALLDLMRADARLQLPHGLPIPKSREEWPKVLREHREGLEKQIKDAWAIIKDYPMLPEHWRGRNPSWATEMVGRGARKRPQSNEQTQFWVIDDTPRTPFLGITWTYVREDHTWRFLKRTEKRKVELSEVPLCAKVFVLSRLLISPFWMKLELFH